MAMFDFVVVMIIIAGTSVCLIGILLTVSYFYKRSKRMKWDE